MGVFWVGLGIFTVGVLLNAVGWTLHRRSVMSAEPMVEWFLEVLRHWFGKLTGPDSTGGERLAAFGAILAALGLVTAIVGLFVYAAA